MRVDPERIYSDHEFNSRSILYLTFFSLSALGCSIKSLLGVTPDTNAKLKTALSDWCQVQGLGGMLSACSAGSLWLTGHAYLSSQLAPPYSPCLTLISKTKCATHGPYRQAPAICRPFRNYWRHNFPALVLETSGVFLPRAWDTGVWNFKNTRRIMPCLKILRLRN